VPFGWTQQFSATMSGSSATAVTWEVNGIVGGRTDLGIISPSGLYTAPAVPPVPATVTISAVSQTDSNLSGYSSTQLIGLFAYVTNQTGGTLNAFSIAGNGTLVPLSGSPIPTTADPFFVGADPQGKHLYVTDTNASDVYTYTIGPGNGQLTQVGLPTAVGSGPRAFAISPSGKYLYVACTNGAGIYGFSIDANSGALTPLPGSPFANLGLRPADITIDPAGKFAFAANNASRSVSEFVVDSANGQLTPVVPSQTAGTAPIWVGTDRSGAYLYALNDIDDTIEAYSVGSTGALSPLATPIYHGVADPLSAVVSPDGKFLYVPNWFANVGAPYPGNTVSVFSIDPTNGNLAAINGSPFATGTGPTSIAIAPFGNFAYVTNEFAGSISGFSLDPATGVMTALPKVVSAGKIPTTIAIVATKP
jgi:6-phosphogluconolactonase (cycloisomerase 2 family)